MFEWEGLKVPVDPKREWGSWMTSNEYCPLCQGKSKGEVCASVEYCKDCVYSEHNKFARRCFYEQWYGKYPTSVKNELPKLTVEVFNRPDCPEWAQWAAVDENGRAYWYSVKPEPGAQQWHRSQNPLGDCQRIENSTRTKFDASDWEHSLIKRPQKELPKLTQEVFNRPDCPDWAQYAVLDKRGIAYYTQYKPVEAKVDVALDWLVGGPYKKMSEEHFEASDWQNSLIKRPAKDLPKLTQTAFHCPDCPKEATKLKVFPANHVVALDKDDKVLSVMELQCEEGELERSKEEWHYGWFYKPSEGLLYSRTGWIIPPVADPVRVQYYPAEKLIGKAVTDAWGDWLIYDVIYEASGRGTVYLKGLKEETIPVDIEDFIMYCRFTGTDLYCCKWEKLQ